MAEEFDADKELEEVKLKKELISTQGKLPSHPTDVWRLYLNRIS